MAVQEAGISTHEIFPHISVVTTAAFVRDRRFHIAFISLALVYQAWWIMQLCDTLS